MVQHKITQHSTAHTVQPTQHNTTQHINILTSTQQTPEHRTCTFTADTFSGHMMEPKSYRKFFDFRKAIQFPSASGQNPTYEYLCSVRHEYSNNVRQLGAWLGAIPELQLGRKTPVYLSFRLCAFEDHLAHLNYQWFWYRLILRGFYVDVLVPILRPDLN